MNSACLCLIAPAILQAALWLVVVFKPINYASWWGWTIMIPRMLAALTISMFAWMLAAFVLFWRYVP